MKRPTHHIERLRIRVPGSSTVNKEDFANTIRKSMTPPTGMPVTKQGTFQVVVGQGEDVHAAIARAVRSKLWGTR